MLKNMKTIQVFTLIALLLYSGSNLFCSPHPKKPSSDYHISTCINELILEKNLSLSKLIVIPCLTCGMFLLHKKILLENIKQNPLLALVGASLFFNFMIDTIIKYKQIIHTLSLFQLSKIISRYLLYAIAIKNTMLQVAKKDNCCNFKEEDFFSTITHDLPLSFRELELFIFELLHTCIKAIHTLHIKIHTDVEEQIYLLCKEHVMLEDILRIYDNDQDLYPLLKNLQENPNQYYKNAAVELNTLIKEQFQYMIKHQSNRL